MKKRTVLILFMAALCLLSACGSSSETQTGTTEEAQAEADETETEETEEDLSGALGGVVTDDGEYIEEEYVEGKLSFRDGDEIGILTDDGSTVSFNIANVELLPEDEEYFVEGCYVEAAYLDAPGATQPYDATYVLVLMNLEEQASVENVNPVLYGTVGYIDINDLIVIDSNGNEITFDNSISRTVTFSNVSVGSQVRVTYMGSIFEENQLPDDEDEDDTGSGTPVALKIVTEDAANSEAALADFIEGPVSSVGEDYVTVDMSYRSFTFNAAADVLAGVEQEQNVRVYYEGALSEERGARVVSIVIN